MINDPIADMLTRIRNAVRVGRPSVAIPFSRVKWNIIKKLEQEGYLTHVTRRGRGVRKRIECAIAYKDGKPVLTSLERKSRPGKRTYIGLNDIKPVKQGYGVLIVSTPRGIVTGREAKTLGVGGEVICEVW